MEESLTHKLLTYIEKHIENFENKKFLEKEDSRSLGIIYTPKELVDYIVSNIFRIYFEKIIDFQNLNKNLKNLDGIIPLKIKNQKVKENLIKKIKNIRILDPSCGSGRFLITIAEKLYQLHRILNPELSDYDIKKAIIQKNLYGIEIDNSAYIFSKLRLIKWLISTNVDLSILHNIDLKSLNLTNFNQIIEKFDLKFNIFNFDFLLEFRSNKFDIIIGNPPYVENKKIKDIEFKKKITKRFKTAFRLFDLSIIFIERSLELLKNNGYLSFILPNKFLSADYGIKIRKLLLNESEIKEIVNISSIPIFQNTATYPIILTLKKGKQSEEQEVNVKIFNGMDELLENSNIWFFKI